MKKNIKPYILLAPTLIMIFGVFLYAIIVSFVQSLGYFSTLGLTNITFEHYMRILSDREFLNSLSFSVYISFTSAIISVLIGVMLAYLLFKRSNKGSIEKILYKIPIIVPHIVAATLVYNVLSQSGIVSRALYNLGIIESQKGFPSLIFDDYGVGIIIAYLWKEIPFIALVVYGVLNNISDKLSQVALNLGANKRQIFFHILLPLTMPSIFTCFIIVFAFAFGAYEVPYLLGPTMPKALAVKAYVEYSSPDLLNRPYAMAINTVITVISFVFLILYNKAFKLMNKTKKDLY